MTAFELLEAMGGIEERYLTERYDRKQARLRAITKYSAMAASLLLVTGIGIGIVLNGMHDKNSTETAAEDFEYCSDCAGTTAAEDMVNGNASPEASEQTGITAELPLLEFSGLAGAYGMEALMAYDVEEIIGSNPWTQDCALTSLPVYRNLSYTDQGGFSENDYTPEELLVIAEEIAEKMGTEIVSHEYNTMMVGRKSEYTEHITSIDAETEFCTINVAVSGMASVRVKSDTTGKPTDDDAALSVYQNFHSLLNFEKPTADIVTSYNIYGDPGYEVSVWDASGDEREQILGYAFDTVMIFGTDSWYSINLGGMYSKKEYLGEYPIISWEEAAEMLLGGRYISTVPDDTFGQPESYDHVELVYRTYDEMIMPYYKFRVHLEEWDDMHFEGEKHFGAYYVPAVSRAYLDESTFWDGSFN